MTYDNRPSRRGRAHGCAAGLHPDEVKQPFPVVAHLGQDVDPRVLVWLDKLGETVGGVPAGADDRAVARKPVSTAMLDRQNQQDAAFAV
ncbi:hypothetical protein ACPCA8_08900 [Streptomyces capoamus]|uniref:hypothetical protein n=1 Tax=Streptomyces capoamus TaxID=68183 RepID=UPI003C2DFF8C